MSDAPSLPLRQLALLPVVAMLLPYTLLAIDDFDDIDDLAGGVFMLLINLGPILAALHAWVTARLDRRLLGRSRSRLWALLEGLGVASGAAFLPIVLHGMALAAAGVVLGRWRWVGRSLASVPFAMGLVLAAGLLAWAAYLRRQRVAIDHDPGTISDIVPTAWLWGAWWFAGWFFAAGVVSRQAAEATLSVGLVMVAAWVLGAVVASLAVARAVQALPSGRIADAEPLAREAAGATAVGLLLPLFLFGLVPFWDDADDTRWALLLTTLIAVPLGVWTQSWGRATRWARWV